MTYLVRIQLAVLLFLFATPPLLVEAAPQQTTEKKIFLASTFPVFQIVRNITCNVPDVTVDLLIPATTGCPHDYAPSPADLQKLNQASLIVLNGLGLDAMLAKAITQENIPVITAAEGISALPSANAEPDFHHGHTHPAKNPHIFTSPSRVALMALGIAQELAKYDAAHAAAYRTNATSYAERLNRLAEQLKNLGTKHQTAVVLYHDALAYLAADAGLPVLAVVQENEDQAPSAARILAVIQKIKQHQQPVLLLGEKQFPPDSMEVIAKETGSALLLLDSTASGEENAPLQNYEDTIRQTIILLEQHLETHN